MLCKQSEAELGHILSLLVIFIFCTFTESTKPVFKEYIRKIPWDRSNAWSRPLDCKMLKLFRT